MSRNGKNIPDNVKERLVSSAIQLFAEQGYEKTSVKEIVAHAGVTKPTLYYYFENKLGLCQNIIEDTFQNFISILSQKLEDNLSLEEGIETMFNCWFDFHREHAPLMEFFSQTMISLRNELGTDFMNKYRDQYGQLVFGFLKQQNKHGLISTKYMNEIPSVIRGLAISFIQQAVIHKTKYPNSQTAKKLTEIILYGIKLEKRSA